MLPTQKYNVGQFVEWQSKDGKASGDGLIARAYYSNKSRAWWYAVGNVHVWVQEELLQTSELKP